MTASRPIMRMVAAPYRAAAVAGIGAVVAIVLAACTTQQPEVPEPSPTPVEDPTAEGVPLGSTVGVIMPPATDVDSGVLDAVEADVARLDASLGPEIRALRAFTPDEPAFVADLAAMLADRGTDLVCLVGEQSWRGVIDLADLHPDRRFCAAGVTTDTTHPDGVDLIEVRADELGHVVGVAARAVAGPTGVVGLVLGGDELAAGPFHAGLLAGLSGAEVVEAEIDSSVTDAVDDVLDDGATVVILDGTAGATEALEHASEHAAVLAPSAVLATGSNVVLTWRVRWDLALRGPVRALVEQGEPSPTSYGLAEGVFTVRLRPAATAAAGRAVDAAIDEITAGRRDPLEPAASEP